MQHYDDGLDEKRLLINVMNLPNAVALVTGGSGGLGSRICSLLAAENVHIAVGFLHGAERADAVCEAILAQGKKSIAVQIDQTNPESIEAAIKKITEQFGGLDILVNNAPWRLVTIRFHWVISMHLLPRFGTR